MLALAITGVPGRLRGDHCLERLSGLRRAPTPALCAARGQEDLERGIRAHDRADVASFRDVVAVCDQRSLALHHRPADLGEHGHARSRGGNLRRADLLGDILSGEQDAAVGEPDLAVAGELTQSRRVVQVDA